MGAQGSSPPSTGHHPPTLLDVLSSLSRASSRRMSARCILHTFAIVASLLRTVGALQATASAHAQSVAAKQHRVGNGHSVALADVALEDDAPPDQIFQAFDAD